MIYLIHTLRRHDLWRKNSHEKGEYPDPQVDLGHDMVEEIEN